MRPALQNIGTMESMPEIDHGQTSLKLTPRQGAMVLGESGRRSGGSATE